MQTPPPINKPKKNKAGLIILIVVAALIILCVVIILVSTSWAKTPEGIAALTQGAINKSSTALSVTIEPTNTPNPENAQQSTKTIKPSKTPIPTKTSAPTKTIIPTSTITITPTVNPITLNEVTDKYFSLTNLQWKEYIAPLIGSRVNWSGYVNNADNSLGNYYVLICVEYNFVCGGFVAQFEVSQNEAYQLKKGQLISITGTIESADENKYIHLKDVIINN